MKIGASTIAYRDRQLNAELLKENIYCGRIDLCRTGKESKNG